MVQLHLGGVAAWRCEILATRRSSLTREGLRPDRGPPNSPAGPGSQGERWLQKFSHLGSVDFPSGSMMLQDGK